jgi:hypothetical protein
MCTLLVGCTRHTPSNINKSEVEYKITEFRNIEGKTYYEIVEVGGHQYLSNSLKGGMIHMESCKCKTQK